MAKDPFIIKSGNFSDAKIVASSLEIDGDILVADSYRKHPRHTWKTIKKVNTVFLICTLLFLMLISKLYYLQIVKGDEFQVVAEGNRVRKISIIPPRGVIFDSKNNRIAYNVPDFALFLVPADLPKDQDIEDEMFKTISEIIKINHFDLIESFIEIPRESLNVFELARGLSQEQAILLKRKSQQWQGIYVGAIEQRAYDFAEEFSHVIGYTGKMSEQDYKNYKNKGYAISEYVGKIGIEKEYQEQLHGKEGTQFVEVDSFGRIERVLQEVNAVQGENIYLFIDSKLQKFVFDELKKTVIEKGTPGGTVIIMNPQNGAILSIVNFPGYNINLFAKGIDSKTYKALLEDASNPLFNRAISGEYASGSTFKIVVGSAALEEKNITRNTSIFSSGGIKVGEYWFPDWKYGGHGQTNIIHALAESVNTFFYAIGGGYEHIDGLGVEKITDYAKKFGLSKPTGIDLVGERSGFLPSKEWKKEVKKERWYLGDTYHLAIGQGDILATPIQVANFTSVIANNGKLYEPRIVRGFGKSEDHILELETKIINKQVVSKNTVNIIRDGLRAAVTYGSAVSLSTLNVDIAGKTGTAQFSSIKDPHAWFTGFAPYKNPEIVVTIIIEEGEGGTITATPLAKKIFEYYFSEDTKT